MQEINLVNAIFTVAILIMSVVIHEVSHGFTALRLGDPTAKYAGRLTLNPIYHLDLFGSFLVPFIMIIAFGVGFGWAKPVPYNPHNLKDPKWGPAKVAVSGPLSNFAVAVVFGLIIRYSFFLGLPPSFAEIAGLIVLINLLLGVFNLLPIPPLDGSKVLFALLPYRWSNIQSFLEKYGFFFLLIFVFFLFQFLLPIIFILFRIITGVGF